MLTISVSCLDEEFSIHSVEFNPITLQCKLCLSEVVNILLNPTEASLNKKSEAYHYCRHRKKYLLAHSKPLALKGGALTYRYKRWVNLLLVHFLCFKSNPYCLSVAEECLALQGMKLPVLLNKFLWRTCVLYRRFIYLCCRFKNEYFVLLNSEHFMMEEVTMLQIQIIGYCRFLKECPQITH